MRCGCVLLLLVFICLEIRDSQTSPRHKHSHHRRPPPHRRPQPHRPPPPPQPPLQPQPPIPVGTPTVDVKLQNNGHNSELVFHCKFNKHQNDKVMYKTTWNVGGKDIYVVGPTWWDPQLIQKHALTEELLRKAGIAKVGFKIRCTVRASFGPGQVESQPIWSQTRFIGIQLSPATMVLKEGQKAEIRLQLTAPFGCGDNTDSEWCALRIESQGFGGSDDNCSATTILGTQNPEVKVRPGVWEQTVILHVFAQVSQLQTQSVTNTQITLKTADMPEHPLWGNYHIGVIPVRLVKDSSLIKSKSCHSVNDPHMKTFDGRYYEQHTKGTFTLYQHADYPIEVQHKVRQCRSNLPNIMCNCGVAVRVGESVFEISRCNGESDWFADYSVCRGQRDLLSVKRKGGEYEIYLPTGGKVKVFTRGRWLNVYIFPSIQDYKKSQGLCGYLSDDCTDDFVMRDGSYARDASSRGGCGENYRHYLPSFANSWKVAEDQNIFNHNNFDREDFLRPWTQPLLYCIYELKDVDSTKPEVQCKPTQGYKTCKTTPGFLDFSSNCALTKNKRLIQPTATDLDPSEQQGVWVTKEWTKNEASVHCNAVFNNSSSVQACRSVVKEEVAASLDNCVLDILMTGTTKFVQFAVDTVRATCLEEVLVNPKFHSIQTNVNSRSIFVTVVDKICPLDCSGNGDCRGGVCICRDGFVGSDCSVKYSGRPHLSWAGDWGLCDTSNGNCDEVHVRGENIADVDFCLIEKIKIYQSTSVKREYITCPATVINSREIKCKLQLQQGNETQQGDYITVYMITVAIRGQKTVSNTVPFMMYNGNCVAAAISGTVFRWEITGPNCMYGGKCFPVLSPHPRDECLTCTVTDGVGGWTPSLDRNGMCTDTLTQDFSTCSIAKGVTVARLAPVTLVQVTRESSRCLIETWPEEYVFRGSND